MMKKTFSFRSVAVLLAVMLMLALPGCSMGNNDPPELQNDSVNGVMNLSTAEKVFGKDGFREYNEHVEIIKFNDVDALGDYILGISRQVSAASPATFKINYINGKPVTSIRPGAFKPDPARNGSDDISRLAQVMNQGAAPADLPPVVIVLPDNLDLDIDALGDGLFEGVSGAIKVEIPTPVIEKILEKEIDKQVAVRAAAEGLSEAEAEALKQEIKEALVEAPQGELVRELTEKLTETIQEAVGKGAGEAITIEKVAPSSPAPANPDAPVVAVPDLPPIIVEPAEPGDNSGSGGNGGLGEEPSTTPPSGGGSGGGGSSTPSTPPPVVSYSLGTISVPVPALGGTPADTVSGTGYSGTVAWKAGSVDMTSAAFEADVSYTAVITVVSWTGYTLSGAAANPVAGAVSSVSSQSGSGAVISAVFPVLADDSGTLGNAIAAAKGSANPVVQLTSGFYSTANSGNVYIAVDAGAADNSTPYTIKGTGKTSSDVLTVGILLANDNVTLQDVKINALWDKGVITPNPSYKAAITIARSADGTTLLAGDDHVNKNVTVQNCDITFTASSGMTAGIYVSFASDDTLYAVPENIIINGNKITVTNSGGSATQGILIRGYGTTIAITNNVVESTNTSGGTNDTPAGGILLQIPKGQDTGTPNISGNSFRGSLFDFYINALSHNDYVGDANLVADQFGTANTVWAASQATDTTSFYKKLIAMLISQSQADGFGALFLYLGNGYLIGDSFAMESYELTNGKVTAIDHWSGGIAGNAYSTVTKLGGNPVAGNMNGSRARRIVNPDNTFSVGNFHWYRSENATASNDLP
jgi:hypothetical protein